MRSSRATAPTKATNIVEATPLNGMCRCRARKMKPPRKAPTIPSTMSPMTPYPPPTTSEANQPATSPIAIQMRIVSMLTVSSSRPIDHDLDAAIIRASLAGRVVRDRAIRSQAPRHDPVRRAPSGDEIRPDRFSAAPRQVDVAPWRALRVREAFDDDVLLLGCQDACHLVETSHRGG